MYKSFGVYNKEDGKLLYTTECAEQDLIDQLPSSQGYAEFSHDQRNFFRDVARGTWVGKYESPLTLSTLAPNVGEDIVLSGLPSPCTVHIDWKKYEVEDSEIEISFSEPGRHVVVLDDAEYLWEEVEVYVSA